MPNHVVLAVDDSFDDLALIKMAAAKAAPQVQLKTLESGEEVIRYVTGEGQYSDRQTHPLPRVIILDLKMPRVSGFEVLKKFQDINLSRPPFIVVMSASGLEEDRKKALELGATAFHVKPIVFNDLCTLVTQVTTFFCTPTIPGLEPL